MSQPVQYIDIALSVRKYCTWRYNIYYNYYIDHMQNYKHAKHYLSTCLKYFHIYCVVIKMCFLF
jgi:hypothetical protein